MLLHIVDQAIRLLLYLAVLGAVIYLFRSVWVNGIMAVKHNWTGVIQRRNLKLAANYNASLRRVRELTNPTTTFELHIRDLIESTLPFRTTADNVVRFFLYICIAAGAFIYLLIYLPTGNLFLPVLPALVVMVLPYFLLRARKYQLSITNSYDIGPIPGQLLAKYRMNNRNMYFALRAVIDESDGSPVIRAMDRFLVRLQRKASDAEARRAMLSFNSQTGTTWAIQLSLLIYKAYAHGIDVEQSLEDLVKDINDVQKALKDNRLDRTDNMLVAAAPIFLWPGGLLFFWGTVSHDFFHLQFNTPEGVSYASYAAIVSVISFIVAVLFYKPKQDI